MAFPLLLSKKRFAISHPSW